MRANLLVSALSISIVFSFSCAESAYANILDELEEEDRVLVERGEQVALTEDVEDSAWPHVYVYQKIDANPEEVTAIFTDYELHQEMFREVGIVRSVIINRPDPATAIVESTMTFPVVFGVQLKDEAFTTWNKVKLLTSSKSYRVDWGSLETETIKKIAGDLKIEAFSSGSIIRYHSFIVPSRPNFAQLIVQMAIDRVKQTIVLFNNQVEDEKQNDPQRLLGQVEVLRRVLGK